MEPEILSFPSKPSKTGLVKLLGFSFEILGQNLNASEKRTPRTLTVKPPVHPCIRAPQSLGPGRLCSMAVVSPTWCSHAHPRGLHRAGSVLRPSSHCPHTLPTGKPLKSAPRGIGKAWRGLRDCSCWAASLAPGSGGSCRALAEAILSGTQFQSSHTLWIRHRRWTHPSPRLLPVYTGPCRAPLT